MMICLERRGLETSSFFKDTQEASKYLRIFTLGLHSWCSMQSPPLIFYLIWTILPYYDRVDAAGFWWYTETCFWRPFPYYLCTSSQQSNFCWSFNMRRSLCVWNFSFSTSNLRKYFGFLPHWGCKQGHPFMGNQKHNQGLHNMVETNCGEPGWELGVLVPRDGQIWLQWSRETWAIRIVSWIYHWGLTVLSIRIHSYTFWL